ncbi:MAG: coproporphyrinogen III oxidase family protein [Verrucomicrobia bacterium]|nr:coproporphyrinogen III oxidase family protein [Verrucomicrobiota bacterium]
MKSTLESPPVRTEVGNYFISNYPPFSCWQPAEIPKLLHALSADAAPGPLGLYVHLPFCRQRCHYCYFRVYPRRSAEDVNLYIDSVLKEFSLYLNFPAFQNRAFSSVYFGGGSPSYPTSDQIRRLLGGLQQRSRWDAVEECTFECEPGTVTPEKLQTLKDLGVTRLSLGFQTLHDDILRRSGRDVRVEDCLRAFRQAREAGFDEINVDLLAGLAGETEGTWQRTMDQVLELMPDCVTIYQLELTYNSRLYASLKSGRELPLPSWPAKRAMVAEGFHMCEAAGYVIGSGYMAIRNPKRWRFVYTVEHFWHGADLLALGETAFGHLRGVHYQNVDTFERYAEWLQKDKLPLRRALRLTPEEKLRREVILHLKTGQLDAGYFRDKFGVDLVDHLEPQFETLLNKGLLEIEGDTVRLTREGLLEVDWLLPDFYLPAHQGVRYT